VKPIEPTPVDAYATLRGGLPAETATPGFWQRLKGRAAEAAAARPTADEASRVSIRASGFRLSAVQIHAAPVGSGPGGICLEGDAMTSDDAEQRRVEGWLDWLEAAAADIEEEGARKAPTRSSRMR
jgi:hypothetical protein